MKKNRYILGIIAAAMLLRIWNIGWGLPELYEEGTPLTKSWEFWNWGKPGFDFNPHFFNYPALTFYVQFAAQAIHFAVGNLLGVYKNLDAFGTNLNPLVVTARLVDLSFDLGTVLTVYMLGKKAFNRNVGITASLIVALNPLHVMQSHLIQVDTILTFFCAVSLFFCYRIYTKPVFSDYIIAGIFIGMAASSKYTGAFLLVTLAGAHLMQARSLKDAANSLKSTPFIASIFAAALIFAITNPFIFITPGEFQKDFSYEQTHIASGHLGVDSSKSAADFYLLNILPSSIGWILFAISIVMVIYSVVRKDKLHLLLLLFPLVYITIISGWEMRADRYLLPAIPALILVSASGIVKFTDWLRQEGLKRLSPSYQSFIMPIIPILLLTLILIEPAWSSLRYLRSIGLPDTRTIAKEWITKNLPRGSVIASGPFGIEFRDESYQIMDIPFIAFNSERVAPFYDTRWYEDLDLLVASSYDHDRYKMEPEKYSAFLPFYDSLRIRWKLLFETGSTAGTNGPKIWLYQFPDSSKKPAFDKSLLEKLDGNPESTRISIFLKELDEYLEKKKKPEKCEQLLRLLLSNEVSSTSLLNRLARTVYIQQKYNQTLYFLEKSIRINPGQAEVFALAGHTLLKIQKIKEGESALSKSLLLNSRLEEPYLALSELYTRLNDTPKLIEILKRYYRILTPGSPEAVQTKKRIQMLEGIK